jgi:hypothetical protein
MMALMAIVLLISSSAAGQGMTNPAAGPQRPEEGQIQRLYAATLARPPESGGFDYWVNQLVEGKPLTQVAQFFLTSAEFEQRFNADTDSAFVDLVYRNVLGRRPDAGGRSYWLDRLAGGSSRDQLVLFFSESAEFSQVTGTVLPALPPFRSSIRAATAQMLGSSWRSGCPVAVNQLSLITVSYVEFNGGVSSGQIAVHDDEAPRIVAVFEQLYVARYPIERMEPIQNFESDDDLSMAANNTSGFNCRAITGGTGWSRHASGRAVDINPRQNPTTAASRCFRPRVKCSSTARSTTRP